MRPTKNLVWDVHKNSDGSWSFDAAQLAVMLDIRDELQTLNAVFRCYNTLAIPGLLRDIRRNTNKRKRKKSK